MIPSQEQEKKTMQEQKKILSEITKDPKEAMHHIQAEFKERFDGRSKNYLDNLEIYYFFYYCFLEISRSAEKFDSSSDKVEDLFLKLSSLKDYYISSCYALNAYDKQQYKEVKWYNAHKNNILKRGFSL